MHQVYIAGSYDAREALCKRAQQLMARGLMITSNWLYWNPPDLLIQDRDRLDDTIWHLDLHGILTADAVIIDTDIESSKGGFHVELGMAIMSAKPVFHIGRNRPNAFYRFPSITHHDTWEELLSKIDETHEKMGDNFMSKLHQAEQGPSLNRQDVPGLIIDLEKFLNSNREGADNA